MEPNDHHVTRKIRQRIGALPRVRLAHLPTPLDPCPRLGPELGVALSIKRDDCTGLAFGGNKTRQLELVLGDAIASGADCVIQGSASQSNHSRQLAAAAARLGLDVVLLPKQDVWSTPVQGNLLVDHLLGATIKLIGEQESTVARKQAVAEELRAQDRKPYIVGMGAQRALALGAVAYVEALIEIIEASGDAGVPDVIFSTSQGSTQAGLQLGCHLLGISTRVIGINPMSADHEAYVPPEQIAGLANEAAALLSLETSFTSSDIVNTTEYVGDGYGVPSVAGTNAIRTLGATEGIVLDPVYTSKGFAGLLDQCRRGNVPAGSRVVFVHTGGLPALFGYAPELTKEVVES